MTYYLLTRHSLVVETNSSSYGGYPPPPALIPSPFLQQDYVAGPPQAHSQPQAQMVRDIIALNIGHHCSKCRDFLSRRCTQSFQESEKRTQA